MDDILRKDSEAHIKNKCPYTIIQCPNKNQGCNATMIRKKLQDHLDKFCSFRSLHCPYTKHGCLFTKKNGKLGMKELQKHLTDSQYRILHLELQLHSLTKQLEAINKPSMMNHHQNIQYNINNNNININNNINGNNNNDFFNSSSYYFQNKSLSNSSNCNLLFAYVGSDEGKYSSKNCILCIDIQKGISETILDPLSIALINNNNNNHHLNNNNSYNPQQQLLSMTNTEKLNIYQQQQLQNDYHHPLAYHQSLKRAHSEKSHSIHTQQQMQYNRNWDIRNHGACVANNANINGQSCKVLFRVGGWNSNDEQEIALPHVDGYIVEHNQWLHNLPGIIIHLFYYHHL